MLPFSILAFAVASASSFHSIDMRKENAEWWEYVMIILISFNTEINRHGGWEVPYVHIVVLI